MRFGFEEANQDHRKANPYNVYPVRKDGSHGTWASWYVRDVEHAKHYVRGNRESEPSEYPLARVYVVVHHRTGEELGRFTVKEAVSE